MVTERRQFLRGLGTATVVGLAGCSGDGTDGSEGSPTTTESPTDDPGGTRPEGTGGPGVTLVSVDDEVGLPVEPAVEVVREAATEEHPPRFETALSNTSDESVRVGEGRAVHFEYVRDDAEALVLLPPDGEYPAEPGCWRLTDGVAVTEEYRTFEIAAGETSRRPVDLYATPGEDACLPVGEYRFETTLSIVSADAEPESSAQWGFTILLE
jgi:hypothetical protein